MLCVQQVIPKYTFYTSSTLLLRVYYVLLCFLFFMKLGCNLHVKGQHFFFREEVTSYTVSNFKK